MNYPRNSRGHFTGHPRSPHPPRSACPGTRHNATGVQLYGCICVDGYADIARAQKRSRTQRQKVPTLGTRRRIRALSRAGYTQTSLAEAAGVGYTTLLYAFRQKMMYRYVAEAVAVVYDQWSMIPGPNRQAASTARTRGWPGPWNWTPETIDDPDAEPTLVDLGDDRVDEVAVLRAISGHSDPRTLNKLERAEAARILTRRGWSQQRIIDHLHTSGRFINAAVGSTGTA